MDGIEKFVCGLGVVFLAALIISFFFVIVELVLTGCPNCVWNEPWWSE
jgi:hypothetical protein